MIFVPAFNDIHEASLLCLSQAALKVKPFHNALEQHKVAGIEAEKVSARR